MNTLDQLLNANREDAVRRNVGLAIDRARDKCPNGAPPQTFPDFFRDCGQCYAFVYGSTIAPGAKIAPHEAIAQAKHIVTADYEERGETINQAFEDAKTRGMRRIFDIIADALRRQSEQNYKETLLDAVVPPNDYDARVDFVRQLFARFPDLYRDYDVRRPERYHAEYRMFLRRLVRWMDENSRASAR